MGNRHWTVGEAKAWNDRQPWVVGCNFIPSTAINQLEMWQAESFDPTTIDRELGWAASIGMNGVRVYLHDLVYEADPAGFLSRIDEFLTIAQSHGIRALLVFFDDCWNPDPELGTQPAPKPGIHNSGWVNSPSKSQRNWPQDLERLEVYVKAVLSKFGSDDRVYAWDLYNEPGASGYDNSSLELLAKVFEWAWEIRPSQPLTAPIWNNHVELNEFLGANSDVINFHNYESAERLEGHIQVLGELGRPLICTEWMARTNGSRVETHLPILNRHQTACFIWGLVSGKTNTIYPWGSPGNGPEPDPWFHDLFRQDGTPYSEAEVAVFRNLTA
jgi:hypothetical protein